MKFWKYQGAGNDFIMLDQRDQQLLGRQDTALIEKLCHRRFGIGADGLILLQSATNYDFEMIYFNADGRESTMCGNGGRCIAAFARHLGFIAEHGRFLAIDGPHEAKVVPKNELSAWVELKMSDVTMVGQHSDAFVLNTGSPHFVRFVDHLDQLDVFAEGRAIRYGEPWKQEGINVNFVEKSGDTLRIRTYERGVEDETLACGTGVTAAALAAHLLYSPGKSTAEIAVKARGGDLSVRYVAHSDGHFSDIWLCGPAVQVFEGEIHL
ncbi:MAG: diaminopimelate epimerase [Saprospiraceae bacterium]|nr:diaminopimelate epimerase [Saprospiraceae bacterium]